jgi:hypothetical protein
MTLRTLQSEYQKHPHYGRRIKFVFEDATCTGVLRRCEDYGMLGFLVYIDQIRGHGETAGLFGFIESYTVLTAARKINAA